MREAVGAAAPTEPRRQTLASFDWQWAHLPAGDFMPGDVWFDQNASRILSEELCAIAPAWFPRRRVLDAGCGQGRWTRALLDLGAVVTAVDYSQAGLERTRAVGGAERLTTRRVDLLDLPRDLASEQFDLVFSFGVLHHTGDTWRALDNVARLVGDAGALVLYLYGERSWTAEQRADTERLRHELAPLPFDEKIAELRRRFPGDDPHQLFDLVSPVINDRVRFEDVAERVARHGFTRIERPVESNEVYLRATRPGFPDWALLRSVGARSTMAAESERRWALRRGAAFEESVRAALRDVPPRAPTPGAVAELETLSPGTSVLDASLPPDRLRPDERARLDYRTWDGPSLVTPRLSVHETFDAVAFLGAAIGTCRDPGAMLEALWALVRPGGRLVVELAEREFPSARRTALEKVMDKRKDVPGKIAAVLRRRPAWCTGEGLSAVGGGALLTPLDTDAATARLRACGARAVTSAPAGDGRTLLVARA